jgi:hypothetical protein
LDDSHPAVAVLFAQRAAEWVDDAIHRVISTLDTSINRLPPSGMLSDSSTPYFGHSDQY